MKHGRLSAKGSQHEGHWEDGEGTRAVLALRLTGRSKLMTLRLSRHALICVTVLLYI